MQKRANQQLCLAICLALSPAASAWADEVESTLFTKAESFSHSAANPITAYGSMLVGPVPRSGTYAFSRNSIEFGVWNRGLSFSIIHRNDYNLEFTSDAATFAYLNRNLQPVPLDQDYDIEVWANQYQATGVKLAYDILLSDSFTLNVAYSHLYATGAVSGYLGKNPDGSGGVIRVVEQQVGGQAVRNLEGELHTDYYFTSDPLFRRPSDSPTGQGFAVDLGFDWQVSPQLRVYGQYNDVAGELRWRDMPHIVADATSNIVEIDEDGLLRATPNFAGQETQRDYRQSLTERQRLGVRYRQGAYLLGYDYDRFPVRDFNWLSVGYHWGERWGVHFAYEVDTSATRFTLISPVGPVSITLDNLDIDQNHTLGVSWSLDFPI